MPRSHETPRPFKGFVKAKTSMISRTGPYGACNGLIEPNRPAGPVTDSYGMRMTIQTSSTGQNRTI